MDLTLRPGVLLLDARRGNDPVDFADRGVAVNGQSGRLTGLRLDGLQGTTPVVLDAGMLAWTAPAVASVWQRSGTNVLRGNVVGFLGTGGMAASEYFSHLRPPATFAQLGVSLGGPISKDRLFFFVNHQSTGNDRAIVWRAALPEAAFRAGDFSAAASVIYDPATGVGDAGARSPFPGNAIPASRISPIARRLLALLPAANRPDAALGQVNYESVGRDKHREHTSSFRLDWHPSAVDRIIVRLAWDHSTFATPAPFDVGGGPADIGPAAGAGSTRFARVQCIRVFSPVVVLEVDGSALLRDSDARLDGEASASSGGIPSVLVQGYSALLLGIPGGLPWEMSSRVLQVGPRLSVIRGSHYLRAGVQFKSLRHDRLQGGWDSGPRGQLTFGPLQTASPTDPASQNGYANAFASFLLDLPDGFALDLPLRPVRAQRWVGTAFLQDDWKATRNLTLTLELRQEYHAPFSGLESDGTLSNYDPATNTLQVAGLGSVPRNFGVRKGRGLFCPRAGVAYRLSYDSMLRARYGLAVVPFSPDSFAGNYPLRASYEAVKAGTYSAATMMSAGSAERPEVSVPSSGILSADTPGLRDQIFEAVPLDLQPGRLHVWSVSLQRTLPLRIDTNIAYVGARGLDLPVLRDLNAGQVLGADNAGRPLSAAFARTATTWTWWRGRSQYRALQVSLGRQTTRLQVTTAYTWGRSLDYASGSRPLSTPADPERSWGRSDFDRTHTLVLAFSYRFLFGGPAHRWHRHLTEGWRLSGILRAQSGTPVDVTLLGSTLGAPGNTQRPNVQGPPEIAGAYGPGQAFFAASAFSVPAAGEWGSLTRNAALTGPASVNLDLALAKELRLGDRLKTELRLEAFNLTNTPQFGNPDGVLGSASFGQVTRTLPESARALRLGARLTF
jgi:hypothetical protein